MFHSFFKHGGRQVNKLLVANKKLVVCSTISTVVLLQHRTNNEFKIASCDYQTPTVVKVLHKEPAVTVTVRAPSQSVFQYMKKVMRHVQRILTYIFYGTPMIAVLPAAYYLGGTFPTLEHASWDYLLWTINRLGPCFIKLAQWMSTRPDLFPPNLVHRLVSLQDDVQIQYSTKAVHNTMREEFGEDWNKTIHMEEKPIGTGSVAQVFKGTHTSKDNKVTPVAIKFIHPHVHQQMETDMELLTSFGNFIDMFPNLELLSLGETMRQFAVSMNSQLDLRNEARNLIKFGKKFEHDKWAEFPQPIEGWFTKNVLVEKLMDGVPIVKYMDEAKQVPEKLKLKLSDLGTRLVTKMIFFDNFIHGDLHPGNLMVKIHPNEDVSLQVLDCGIVYSSQSEAEHNKLVEVCFAFMNHEGRKAAQLMVDMNANKLGVVPTQSEGFVEGIQALVDRSEHEAFFQHVGDYMDTICQLARDHRVRLDPGYFKIAMALKVCEGMSLQFEPDLDLVSKTAPVIMKVKAMRKLGLMEFPVDEDIDKGMYVRGHKEGPAAGKGQNVHSD